MSADEGSPEWRNVCEYCGANSERGDACRIDDLHDEAVVANVREIGRLRQALLDAQSKAELGAQAVDSPGAAGGFRVIADHCRQALLPPAG